MYRGQRAGGGSSAGRLVCRRRCYSRRWNHYEVLSLHEPGIICSELCLVEESGHLRYSSKVLKRLSETLPRLRDVLAGWV